MLDIPGLITSALALFSLTYALIEGGDKGWTSALIVAAFAVAAVAAAVFLAIESRSAHPMVPLSVFRSAAFSGGLGTMMIWAFGVLGIYFFTSLYLQDILGFSPTKAGLAFVPMALCLAIAAILSPRVTAVIGEHRTVALGMAIMTVGLVLFAQLGAGATFDALLPGFVLFGLGAGLMNVPLTNAVLGGAPTAQAGMASALLNASREVAGLLGVTVIGAVLRSSESSSLRSGVSQAQAFVDGYHSGLWLTIGLLAAGVVLSYVTLRPRRTGELTIDEALAGLDDMAPGTASGTAETPLTARASVPAQSPASRNITSGRPRPRTAADPGRSQPLPVRGRHAARRLRGAESKPHPFGRGKNPGRMRLRVSRLGGARAGRLLRVAVSSRPTASRTRPRRSCRRTRRLRPGRRW